MMSMASRLDPRTLLYTGGFFDEEEAPSPPNVPLVSTNPSLPSSLKGGCTKVVTGSSTFAAMAGRVFQLLEANANGDVLDGRVVVNLEVDANVAGRVGNAIGRVEAKGAVGGVMIGCIGVAGAGTEEVGALTVKEGGEDDTQVMKPE